MRGQPTSQSNFISLINVESRGLHEVKTLGNLCDVAGCHRAEFRVRRPGLREDAVSRRKSAPSLAFCFLRGEPTRSKKTFGVSLPMMRRLLQASLIRIAGRCPWCLTRFDDTS